MKRPAASLPPADVPSQKSKQPPMKRPAASSDAAGKPKKMMKKPASFDAGSTSQPGPVPVGNGKKMPSKARRVELCPGGCSTCRFVPGHAPSCWVKKRMDGLRSAKLIFSFFRDIPCLSFPCCQVMVASLWPCEANNVVRSDFVRLYSIQSSYTHSVKIIVLLTVVRLKPFNGVIPDGHPSHVVCSCGLLMSSSHLLAPRSTSRIPRDIYWKSRRSYEAGVYNDL